MTSLFTQSRVLHKVLDDYCQYVRDMDIVICRKYIGCVKYRYNNIVVGLPVCMLTPDEAPSSVRSPIAKCIICYRRLRNTTYDNNPQDT